MVSSLQEMLDRLRMHPHVIGIVRYGGRSVGDMSPGGDFDLFVFLRERIEVVESLHFYVRDIPVDLNLRIFDDLQREIPLTQIDPAVLSGEILFDSTGQLAAMIKAARENWLIF